MPKLIMNEKFKKYLKESKRHLQIADHMTYITYPLVNEKKLIIKIFEEIYKSLENSINAAIYYEFEKGNIILNSNNEKNLLIFFDTISKNYNLNEKELSKIKEIIEIEKKHKKSAVEFTKEEKVVMLSDNLKTQILTIDNIKEYLNLLKGIFLKISKVYI